MVQLHENQRLALTVIRHKNNFPLKPVVIEHHRLTFFAVTTQIISAFDVVLHFERFSQSLL
jgi:hypothetical protein